MRACLASPPAHGFLGEPTSEAVTNRQVTEDAALGVLTLIPILESSGFPCRLIHLTDYIFRAMRESPGEDPALVAGRQIAELPFDILGLSTICSSYPVTLRIASEVKRRRPDSFIILGGPQASVTDVATMDAFPAVDLVVRGEADETFPRVMEALAEGKPLDGLLGITFRSQGKVVRNPNAPPVLDLDGLPFPAFNLLPAVDKAIRLPLEIGRGCPFSCTFCSTNDFFRRRFRLKSSNLVVRQMAELQDRYPAVEVFDLTHDMFTVDRRRVVEFCRAIIASGRKMQWNCSARTDCVDEELIELMAEAGCVGIFFGIETGSARVQKLIDKSLDLDEARHAIQCTVRRSIITTVATIIGFPDEEAGDLSATLDFLFDSARQRYVQPQISLLAPLAQTPIHDKFREFLIFDGGSSELCHQGFPQKPADIELIRKFRDVFQSFYTVPTSLSPKFLREAALFFEWVLLRCRWLGVALTKQIGGPLACFHHWLDFRGDCGGDFSYYSSHEFQRDFVRFAARYEHLSRELRILVAVQLRVAELDALGPVQMAPETEVTPESIPALARAAIIFIAPGDPEEAIASLSSASPLHDYADPDVVLAARRNGRETHVFRPSHSMLEVLSRCDASRTALEIAVSLEQELGAPLRTCDAVTGWLATLEYLRQEGFLEIRPPAVHPSKAA